MIFFNFLSRRNADLEHTTLPVFGSFQLGAFSRWYVAQIAKGKTDLLSKRLRLMGRDRMRRSTEIADVVYDGFRLRLYPSENTCDMEICLYQKHSEEDEFRLFEAEVSGKATFVDIGANIGLYSLRATRAMAPSGRVIAFEPDCRTAQKLRKNLELNDVCSVEVVEKALGRETGELQLYSVSKKNAGRNSLRAEIGKRRPSRTVQVVPLFDELTKHDFANVDVMKIDVEGFEDEVLVPFFETAPRNLWPKYLMVEVVLKHLWGSDLIAKLEMLGYERVFENSGNIHFRLLG